jgi:hypothetical protein
MAPFPTAFHCRYSYLAFNLTNVSKSTQRALLYSPLLSNYIPCPRVNFVSTTSIIAIYFIFCTKTLLPFTLKLVPTVHIYRTNLYINISMYYASIRPHALHVLQTCAIPKYSPLSSHHCTTFCVDFERTMIKNNLLQ